MAQAIVTIKLMPESPEVDLAKMQGEAEQAIDAFVGEKGEKRFAVEPVAFGLKSLKITFVMQESIGSTEPLEEKLAAIEGVNSVDVVDVRRAIG